MYSKVLSIKPSPLIPVALFDVGLDESEREALALAIKAQSGETIKLGKPVFPLMTWPGGLRPSMDTFVTKESWLIFDLLQLTGDWLSVPCKFWPNFSEYLQMSEFCKNIPMINDSAERGCHLITKFMDGVKDKEARQDLIQCIQHYRSIMQGNLTKKSLEENMPKF